MGFFLVMMCHSVETASSNVKSAAMDDSDGLHLLPQNTGCVLRKKTRPSSLNKLHHYHEAEF